MTDPCKQEGVVSALQERTCNHDVILRGIKGTLEKNNELLSQIAVVMSNVQHLHQDAKRNENDINELFGRVRNLELLPGRGAGKAWLIVLSAVAGGFGSLITGLIIFSLNWILIP